MRQYHLDHRIAAEEIGKTDPKGEQDPKEDTDFHEPHYPGLNGCLGILRCSVLGTHINWVGFPVDSF